jgi:predicted MPP superfamily phosphohydrolase
MLFLFFIAYAWWRFRFVFPRKYRYPGALLFVLCLATGFLHRQVGNDYIAAVLQAIGAFAVVFLANWIFFCLFWDLYLGIRRLLGKRKLANKIFRMKREPVFAKAIALLTIAFFLIGVPAHYSFKITTVKINLGTSPKKALRMALFSDIHFDNLFPKNKMERIVDSLRVLQPDAVFFAGDLSDIHADKLNAHKYDSLFRQINVPLGFFAVTGNHEAFGKPDRQSIEWLENLGNLTLLMDNTVCNEYFCVTGRFDHQFKNHNPELRIPLKELVPENDSIPWFLLDHQPRGLDKQDTGLSRLPNFAMSGHTHGGQFFPANIIIHFIWRLVYGLGNLDGIPWYVSSGIGQWMPVRTFSSNELVLFVFE